MNKKAKKPGERTLTGTIKVSLCSAYGPQDLLGTDDELLSKLSFHSIDMSKHGYTLIGSAEVKMTIFDGRKIVEEKIEALKHEERQILAEAEAKRVRIRRQISELLAIELDPRST